MSITPKTLEALVAAMLTVNQFPVDRAFALVPALRERGLLDPAQVAALTQEQVIERMNAAGYQRGGFLPIVSFRLFSLMEAARAGSLDAAEAAVGAKDEAGFAACVTRIAGIGPRVAATAWMLRVE